MAGYQHLKAIVFDWAGTMIDHGSCAPTVVFQRVFADKGVTVTAEQARGPMGMAKREHIAAVAALPAVAAAWKQQHGSECAARDIDAMYADFLPMQQSVLAEYSQLIEGAAAAADACRADGLAIGSTTGYTRQLMESVSQAAREQGYRPDLVLCADDAPCGRPAPYLLYQTAIRLQVYPLSTMVKVDDTVVGIQAGRNAGCWTIGICCTGNLVGLSKADWDQLAVPERTHRCRQAREKLSFAGAHFLAHSVAEIPEILREIDRRMQHGSQP